MGQSGYGHSAAADSSMETMTNGNAQAGSQAPLDPQQQALAAMGIGPHEEIWVETKTAEGKVSDSHSQSHSISGKIDFLHFNPL